MLYLKNPGSNLDFWLDFHDQMPRTVLTICVCLFSGVEIMIFLFWTDPLKQKASEIIKNKNWIYKILTLLWDFGDLVFKPIGFDGISTNLDKIKFFCGCERLLFWNLREMKTSQE